MNQPNKERFKTSVGGQALMEGIMMRGPKNICCAVRKPDGTIETKVEPTPTHGVWTKIPLVRGAIAMIESLIMGYKYMMYSAQVSMGDDYDPAEEETAFEKWVGDHLGKKAEDALLACAAVLGGLLAILLFTVLPTLIVGGVNHFVTLGRWAKVVLEAVLKVGIFLTYMVAISKMKEIHRVFEYHGAEHKTIACYEAGDELTVENVRKYTRFHPRCGTSFLILVVIVSVFLYSVLPWGSIGLRVSQLVAGIAVVGGVIAEILLTRKFRDKPLMVELPLNSENRARMKKLDGPTTFAGTDAALPASASRAEFVEKTAAWNEAVKAELDKQNKK